MLADGAEGPPHGEPLVDAVHVEAVGAREHAELLPRLVVVQADRAGLTGASAKEPCVCKITEEGGGNGRVRRGSSSREGDWEGGALHRG